LQWINGEGKMREEIRLELQRKIAEKFEQARGPEPRKMSEEERQARTAEYAELLFKSGLRQTDSH
jgi:hypothetical protein